MSNQEKANLFTVGFIAVLAIARFKKDPYRPLIVKFSDIMMILAFIGLVI